MCQNGKLAKGSWKRSTREPRQKPSCEPRLAAGQLKFRLHGHKLQGSFALVRTRGFGKKESWLLIKHRDGYTQAGYDANVYDSSAISGRSLAEIAAQSAAQ